MLDIASPGFFFTYTRTKQDDAETKYVSAGHPTATSSPQFVAAIMV